LAARLRGRLRRARSAKSEAAFDSLVRQHAGALVVSADPLFRFAELIQPLLEGELAGLSANATAQELNRRGVQTARCGSWTARSVLNLKARVS
jgi:hypothetical protein